MLAQENGASEGASVQEQIDVTVIAHNWLVKNSESCKIDVLLHRGAAPSKFARKDRQITAISDPLRHLVVCHDRIEEHLQILERVIPHLRSDSEQKRQEVREAQNRCQLDLFLAREQPFQRLIKFST
jgi:hypothetical protein